MHDQRKNFWFARPKFWQTIAYMIQRKITRKTDKNYVAHKRRVFLIDQTCLNYAIENTKVYDTKPTDQNKPGTKNSKKDIIYTAKMGQLGIISLFNGNSHKKSLNAGHPKNSITTKVQRKLAK